MIDWASKAGPDTGAFVTELLNSRRHPEQGYRTVNNILSSGFDQMPLPTTPEPTLVTPVHDNIRGPSYYHTDTEKH